ncbi:hypothetical protein ACFL5V_12350 [Fibrobacterota bacterium]
MEKTDNLYFAIKLYHSDNHLGYNAVVKVLKISGEERDLQGVLYLSFDHRFPRFIWENTELTPHQREYLELKAQVEVEKHIAHITREL